MTDDIDRAVEHCHRTAKEKGWWGVETVDLGEAVEYLEGLAADGHYKQHAEGFRIAVAALKNLARPRGFPEQVALMHSELSEALEEWREGKPLIYYAEQEDSRCQNGECQHKRHDHDDRPGMKGEDHRDGPCAAAMTETVGGVKFPKLCGCQAFLPPPRKPEGVAVELVDCLIRMMDYFGSESISMSEVLKEKMQFNNTRPHRHGGKRA